MGITRAERELFLSYCRVREFRGSRQVTIPSQFLSELPADEIAVRDISNSGFPSVPAPRRMDRRPSFAPASGFRLTTAAALGGDGAVSGPSDLNAFRPGVVVVHPMYGLGKIMAIEGAGPDRKGRVSFTVGGERTFILAKSPLKPLSGG